MKKLIWCLLFVKLVFSFTIPSANADEGISNGPALAPITIIAYLDFNCPACAKAAQTLDDVIKSYPDEIRLIVKPYASIVTSEGLLFHEAVMAAGEQNQSWEMYHRLILQKGEANQAVLLTEADALKLKIPQFKKALEERRFRGKVVNEVQEAKGFGVTSAPTFFINGKKLVGARSLGHFKRIIDEELGLVKPAPPLLPPPTQPEWVAPDEIHTEGSPSLGPINAPVVIVEFSDFQCPFCARVVPTLHELVKAYPTQVRLVFKNFPLDFHADSPLAHDAALSAGEQGRFWEMHDLIFSRQQTIKRDHLISFAKELGLDMERFIKDLDSGQYKARVEGEIQEGRSLGISGTPTFFVNGQRLVGARPKADFIRLIEAELISAKTK